MSFCMFELNQPWQPPWILTKLSPCITTMMRCVQESPRPQTKRWVSGCYMMPGWGSFGNQLIPASIISFYFCTSHERCIMVVNSTCTMWYETLSSFRYHEHIPSYALERPQWISLDITAIFYECMQPDASWVKMQCTKQQQQQKYGVACT